MQFTQWRNMIFQFSTTRNMQSRTKSKSKKFMIFWYKWVKDQLIQFNSVCTERLFFLMMNIVTKTLKKTRHFFMMTLLNVLIQIELWWRLILLCNTEKQNASSSKKNYDDDKNFTMLSNESVKISLTKQEKRTQNDSSIHKIHISQQIWRNWRTERNIKFTFKKELTDVSRKLKRFNEWWR